MKAVADEVTRILKSPNASEAVASSAPAKPQAVAGPLTVASIAALYETARKCMRKRDYEQVVQILEKLPEQARNDDVLRLLSKARQLADEVQFLIAEIDEALRMNDNEALRKKTDELLKLKPGHRKALQIKEELSRYGGGFLRWRGTRAIGGRRVGEGSWIPWAAIGVFLVVFGGTSWLVYHYMHEDGTVLDLDPIGASAQGHQSDPPPLAIAPFEAQEAAEHQQRWADHLNSPVGFSNSVGMTFRLIPAGEFEMGSSDEMIARLIEKKADAWDRSLQPHYDWRARVRSETPPHRVRLTRPYYLGVHEVTQQQFHDVMQASGADPDEPARAVDGVSWLEAVEFCNHLSARERRSPCYARDGGEVTLLDGDGYRLPTEAEWEFACRAGTATAYPFGDLEDEPAITEYGWVFNNSRGSVHPVGQLQPNAFGLYDMLGNVKEWVWDWYGEDYYSQPGASGDDPLGPDSGPQRVARGGYASRDPASCRPASRYPSTSDGLRIVLAGRPPEGLPSPAAAPFAAAQAADLQKQWADFLGVPENFTNQVGMEFRLIPPGDFPQGDADGERIKVADAFYLGIHEVTQDQYQQVMNENPSRQKGAERPVHDISWDNATEFCRRLAELPEHAAAGHIYRLPTEAEWEHACRAGSTAAFSFGDDASQLDQFGWFDGNSNNAVHPVGQKTANAWSVHDMHGNVYEWCLDAFGDDRPLRSGCWFAVANRCSAAARRTVPASDTSNLTGFRVLLEIDGADAGASDSIRRE